MKKIKLVILLFVLGMSTNLAWGSTYYQSRLTVSVADGSTGEGKVYVAEGNGALDLSQCADSYSSISQGGDGEGAGEESSFTIYAVAKRGKMFSSWSGLTGDGSPAFASGFSASTNPAVITMIKATKEAYTNTESPWDTYYWNAASIFANFADNSVPAWNVKFLPATNGTYSVVGPAGYDSPITLSEETVHSTYDNDIFQISATPSAGYVFYRYYAVDGDGNKYTLGELAVPSQQLTLLEGTKEVCAEFTNNSFLAGGITHATLGDAIQALRKNDGIYEGTVLLLKNDTIPTGYYTIPEGVTLLIPYNENQTSPKLIIDREVTTTDDVPTEPYLTLTLASGVTLNVYGTIEVGGVQYVSGNATKNGYKKGTGRPGAFSQLVMNDNCSIILNSDAKLRAWGYITGSGSIDARRGSEVREQFQIMDWKGGSNALAMMDNPQKVFPVNQYFIQNVEVATLYRPGSRLFTCMSACNDDGSTMGGADNVQIVGIGNRNDGGDDDIAMFLMDDADDSEDTWVRKSYDVANDKQIYDINNSAYLNAITIDLPAFYLTFTSSSYDLPITNNMKIHLLSGNMKITQDVVMLPGSEMQIDKMSTVTINAGKSLYLYDLDQWGNYAYPNTTAKQVPFRPGGVRARPALADAALNVKGTFEVKGALYTTEGGANIYSTIADAGTVQFSANAGGADTVYQWKSSAPNYFEAACTSAQLKNELGASTQTIGTVATEINPKSYCFIDINEDGKGEWVCLTNDDDHCMVYDQGGVYYIKPKAYVPISSGVPTPESDHTYRDHYMGTDSIYIHTIDCQWWCVYPVDENPGLFECRHKDNHTYYFYDDSDSDPQEHHWKEKKFSVTFKNWDGTVLTYKDENNNTKDHYDLPYGAMPAWMSTNPTRPADPDTTYSFTGWTPALHAVTSDQVYTATYSKEVIKYNIIFKFNEENGGAEIERQQLERNANPVAPPVSKDGFYLKWTPDIHAVTGNQTYEAEWLSEAPTAYAITFYDYDGTVLKPTGEEPYMVAVGETPVAPSNLANKLATNEFTYDFDHWSPDVEAVSHNGPKSYTAIYRTVPRTYAIKFYKENGDLVEGDYAEQYLAYGATPEVPEYSKDATASKTYTLVWSPLVGTVTGAQDYTATFTSQPRMYTVTWKNYDGMTIKTDQVAYGATPAYSGLTPAKEDETKIYTFTGWGAISAVAGNQEYTATFDEGHLKTVEVALNATNSTSGHVETLILNASETASGQLTGNITATTAYYDLKFTNGERRHWHAFGVPWQVNLDTDPLREVETGRTFVLGRDYDIMYYNGAKRAANGPGANCWEYVEHNSHILQPGQGYMIAFTSDVQTIRFAKKAYAPVVFSGTVNVPANTGSETTNSGINAIANPMTYYASLSVAGVGQVHDGGEIGHDGYTEYNLSDPFVVGKAVYVQVTSGQTLTPSSGISPAAAPARRAAKATDKEYLSLNDFYTVSLTSSNGQEAKTYVLPEEDKEEEYVIGHDLVKMGMSDRKPQIWVNRYDVKLGLNTTAPEDGVAEFPISVYAPSAGEYTIRLNAQPDEDYIVYLTQDGEAIWNLSDAPYAISLSAGVNKTYGLRLDAHKIPTAIDEAIVDAQGDTRKVLINNQVFIIRGNNVYSVHGQLVK